MHAKSLLPAGGGWPATPLLLATTSAPHLLVQLQRYGFGTLSPAGEFPSTVGAELRIDHTRLQLVVDGQALLDDEDGRAPDGWWRAVDEWGGQCIVWVIAAPVDLGNPDLGQVLNRLVDAGTDLSVTGRVPVLHTIAPDAA